MTTSTPSRIKVACKCGKKFLVKPELIGKRGPCPSCKEELVIRKPKKDPKSKKSASKFRQRVQKNKALNDQIKSYSGQSIDTHTFAVSVCVLLTLVAIAIQSQLTPAPRLVFLAVLAITCIVTAIAVRITSRSDELIRALSIAIPCCFAVVAASCVIHALTSPNSADYFDVFLLMVPLGPALIYASLRIDTRLQYFDESDNSSGRTIAVWHRPQFQFVAAACGLVVLFAGIYQARLDGPQFLFFYFMIALTCCFFMAIVRVCSAPTICFILVVLAFEAVGMIRFAYGAMNGMHQFSILGQMMLFGPIGIVAFSFVDKILGSLGSGSGNSWSDGGYGDHYGSYSSCSSGGSSCGGGGCGGGGCGGCGG